MNRKIATLLAFLLLVGSAEADLLPPGIKTINQQYLLTNLDDYPDYVFALVGEHYRQELTSGQPFSVWRSSEPVLYLQATRNKGDERAGQGSRPDIIRSGGLSLKSQITMQLFDPAERSVIYYKVELYQRAIELQRLDEKRFDNRDNEVPVIAYRSDGTRASVSFPALALLFVGISALVCLVIIMTKRRRQAAANA